MNRQPPPALALDPSTLESLRAHFIGQNVVGQNPDGTEAEFTDEEIEELERQRARASQSSRYDRKSFAMVYGLSPTEITRALAAGLPHVAEGPLVTVHTGEARAWLAEHRAEIADATPRAQPPAPRPETSAPPAVAIEPLSPTFRERLLAIQASRRF